jgi:hypothetical protein
MDNTKIPYKDWHTQEMHESTVSPQHHEELSKYEWFGDGEGVFRLDGPKKIYQHNDVWRLCIESGYTVDKNGRLVKPKKT